MNSIQVDDEVYKALETMVTGFSDTPNQVLRRLLKINGGKNETFIKPKRKIKSATGKAPKTNILELINKGLLQEGQKLFLHDYQGNKINGIEAVLRGNQY